MSIEENKKLVRRYFEDAPFNPAACDEIFAPHFLFHTMLHASVTPQTMESDPESEKLAYDRHKATFGGFQFKIEMMIAEDDRVMVFWTSQGTHIGEFYGLPPTGKQVNNSGINVFRVENGKIVEIWDMIDRLWEWQQLGVLPDLKDAIARVKEG